MALTDLKFGNCSGVPLSSNQLCCHAENCSGVPVGWLLSCSSDAKHQFIGFDQALEAWEGISSELNCKKSDGLNLTLCFDDDLIRGESGSDANVIMTWSEFVKALAEKLGLDMNDALLLHLAGQRKNRR